MKLLDKLREVLERKQSKIKVRGEISGTDWAEVRMKNITEEPITLGTPIVHMKIGIQSLASGAICFTPKEYRIDNAHGFLHKHSGALVFPLGDKTMSAALLALFGKEYGVLENQSL
jgi:hypothetical protein